jgi:photosystem II stability/assembly factor-like uncharacterized protein
MCFFLYLKNNLKVGKISFKPKAVNLRTITVLVFLLIILLSITYAQSSDPLEKLLSNFLTWRNIGPAVPGGRTVDIDVVESNPNLIYAAVGPSGVWKSENNGVSWFPVFYKEVTVSVGALAVAQSSPEIIWVGTGEATCRNSVTIGDGVYKSTDGGKTWTNMGLKDTRHISRILISRGDANVVYVAAMGHLWGPNPERGVYKTVDGGKTWTKVLYINENTGICDLEMDPANSQILYAAAYEHRRLPYKMISGGPGSGIYKSTDGGQTWVKLSEGLPSGTMGRIGLAVARSKPGVVYALIEHQDPGLWRSEDYGQTWKRMCSATVYKSINNRPFYYSQIYVDPSDDATVYVQSTGLYVSKDMGQKFKAIGAGTHPDHHALWIDPKNPLHLIDGNDGGIDITFDGGKTWWPVVNIDAAEVYQVGYDFNIPYRVYCGLQDNGCWGGPSNSLDSRGILNEHWEFINGGDGFFVRPDPKNSYFVYANSQNNGLVKRDLRAGLSKGIRPEAPFSEKPYRFNWNAPIMISPHDPQTIYCGGNFLFRSRDGGYSWEKISPDLTTNDPKKQVDGVGPITPENSGAEVHCTITALAESPVKPGILWCGSDDGLVHVSTDGGQTWVNVTKNFPGLPAGSWCSRIEASHFEPGTAYVSFDNHRVDDYRPYVFKTTDFGRTWKSIKSNLPDFGWVHVIREHPANKNLLFVGTEFGIYLSYNCGLGWIKIHGTNLPTVSVNDIAIHPRDNDLIIGTHGRGVWILDDISFLTELTPEIIKKDFYLFRPRDVYMMFNSSRGEGFGSGTIFSGKNPAFGLNLIYLINKELSSEARFQVKDQNDKTITELPLAKKVGLNKTSWSLQFLPEASDGKKYAPGTTAFNQLCYVTPGQYKLILKIGDQEYKTEASIRPDPRFEMDVEGLREQYKLIGELARANFYFMKGVSVVKNINKALADKKAELEKRNGDNFAQKQEVLTELEALIKTFSSITDIFQTEGTLSGLAIPYEKFLRGPTNMFLLSLWTDISSFPGRPTVTQKERAEELINLIYKSCAEVDKFNESQLKPLNEQLKKIGLQEIAVPTKIL